MTRKRRTTVRRTTTIHEATQTRAANTTSPTPAGDGQLHAGSKETPLMETQAVAPETQIIAPIFEPTGDLTIGKNTSFVAIFASGDGTRSVQPVVGFVKDATTKRPRFDAMVMHPWDGQLIPARSVCGFVGVVHTFRHDGDDYLSIPYGPGGTTGKQRGRTDPMPFLRNLDNRTKAAAEEVKLRAAKKAKSAKAAKKEVAK